MQTIHFHKGRIRLLREFVLVNCLPAEVKYSFLVLLMYSLEFFGQFFSGDHRFLILRRELVHQKLCDVYSRLRLNSGAAQPTAYVRRWRDDRPLHPRSSRRVIDSRELE